MKKVYMSPQAVIITVNAQPIMAGSPNGKYVFDGNADSSIETLSRRNNYFDFDDEEDEDFDDF